MHNSWNARMYGGGGGVCVCVCVWVGGWVGVVVVLSGRGDVL